MAEWRRPRPSALVTRPTCSWTSTCWSDVQPPPPSSTRHVRGEQAELDRPRLMGGDDVLGQVAAVHLGLDLERDELIGERAGASLDPEILV